MARKTKRTAGAQETTMPAGKSTGKKRTAERTRRAREKTSEKSSKKYIIRENEILYFSESRGLLEIPSTHLNYREILDELMSDGCTEKRMLELYDEKKVNLERETQGVLKKRDAVCFWVLQAAVLIPLPSPPARRTGGPCW